MPQTHLKTLPKYKDYCNLFETKNADILLIKLKDGEISDSKDIAERIIVHYSLKNEPLEIEILDASKLVSLGDVDISWKELLPQRVPD